MVSFFLFFFFLDDEMIFVHAQTDFQAYFMIAVGLFFIVYTPVLAVMALTLRYNIIYDYTTKLCCFSAHASAAGLRMCVCVCVCRSDSLKNWISNNPGCKIQGEKILCLRKKVNLTKVQSTRNLQETFL